MTDLASTDITITLDPIRDRHVLGKIKMGVGTVAFGDGALTYPYGGIQMPAVGVFGMNKVIDAMNVMNGLSGGGYEYRYDKTNRKVKVFAAAPPIVFEELLDCDADTAYLKYPAAYIISIASANIRHDIVSGLTTPATGQVAVSLYATTPGVRPKMVFYATEGAAATYVTYITQAWKEVFDNLVEDEEPSYSTNVFTLAAPLAVAIQNATWDDDGTIKAGIPQVKGQTATGAELEVDFGEGSPDSTTLTMAAGFSETDDALYVTYIAKPSSGFLYDRFVEEDDLTPSSDIATLSSDGHLSNMLLYGTMGCIPADASEKVEILRSGATLSTTKSNGKMSNSLWIGGYGADTFTMGSSHADSKHIKPSYIWGHPSEIAPLEMLELPDGEIVQSTILDFMVWGQ